MDKLTIHRSDKISVWCYPKLGVIHHQMHGYCYEDAFRTALEAGTRAMRQFGARGWLSDDRANGAQSPSDEDWGQRVWLPDTQAAGWRYWAVVKPQTAVGRLNVVRMVTKYRQSGIQAEFFEDVGGAFSWLRACRAKSTSGKAALQAAQVPIPTNTTPPRGLEKMVRMAEALRSNR